jgi:hypothetical protein
VSRITKLGRCFSPAILFRLTKCSISHLGPSANKIGLFGWANLIMNAISRWCYTWQLFHLRREIAALVRVVRRIDRQRPDDHGAFLVQAEADQAGMRVSASGQWGRGPKGGC